LTKTGG
jgi:hypothetical protein